MSKLPALIVFTRAPRAGRTKTRLIPALGPAGAAELHRCFLLDTLGSLRALPADIIVAAADPSDAAPVRELTREVCSRAELVVQSEGDLGERLADAIARALARGHPRAVVIGTDAPDLPAEWIAQGLELGADHDLVIGPSSDGGYYLIGLRAPAPELFRGLEWGSARVLSETRARARAAGLSLALLESWCDVDTPEALDDLRARLTRKALSGEPITCPRTWGCLCEMESQEA